MQAYKSSPLSADITKLVKTNYDPLPAPPYKCRHVSNRTKKNLIEERPKDLWQRHYDRREDNLNRGFQSVQWEAYKPVGGKVVLDPYELVFTSLRNNLNPKVWRQPRAFKFSYEEKKEKRKMSILPPLLTDIHEKHVPEDSDSVSSLREDICPTAGYQQIRDYLKKSKHVLQKLRGGQPYEECIKMWQESEKTFIDDKISENEMVLMSLSDMIIGQPQQPVSLDAKKSSVHEDIVVKETIIHQPPQPPPAFVLNVDEEPPTLAPPAMQLPTIQAPLMPVVQLDTAPSATEIKPKSKTSLHDELTLNLPGLLPVASFIGRSRCNLAGDSEQSFLSSTSDVSPFLFVPSITDTVSDKKRRLRRDHLQFLQALNIVLTSIHNMKSRDLKSKVALSSDYLKLLQKDHVPFSGPPDNVDLKPTNIARYQSRHTRGMSTTSVNNEPSPFHPGMMGRRGTVFMDPSMAILGAQKFTASAKSMKKARMSADQKNKKSSQTQLDTWEDLLAVEDYRKSSIFTEKTSMMTGGVSAIIKALAWHRRVQAFSYTPPMSSSPETTQRDPQPKESTIPQVQSSFTDNRDKQQSSRKLPIWQLIAMEKPTDLYKEKKKRRYSPDPSMVVDIQRSKFNKLKCSVEKETKSELERIEREKMATFKCKYAAFKNMSPLYEEHKFRLRLKRKNVNLDPTDIQPSLWYEQLNNKTFESSYAARNDEEFNDVLQKISKFSHMDGKSLLYGKAKLCLLVMSLPISEMWTFAYQKAAKYVLETIMECDVNDLIDWLNIRKMTFILDK